MARNTVIGAVIMALSMHVAYAQYAPVAGLPGSTAIPADSSCFVEWANRCTVVRGPVNIADTALGYASAGADSDALGPPDDYTVSLGDGGYATVTFNSPIYNGNGFDFAVFENGFMTNDSNMAFLELGFVEVSTNGVRYVRFPAVSNVEDTTQVGSFGSEDGGQLYNLAGKYIARYGTPFDLEELVDSPGIDVNNIRYVKVIDVVGSVDSPYATHDHNGHIVNDPWPTPYASCGFDLDAVGVINALGATGIKAIPNETINAYPNPVHQGNVLRVVLPQNNYSIKLFDVNGQLIGQWLGASYQQAISTKRLAAGVYLITAETGSQRFNTKFIVE